MKHVLFICFLLKPINYMTADVLYIYKKESKFKVLSHSATLDIIKTHNDLIENGFEHVETINAQLFIEHRLNTGEIKRYDNI